MVSEDQLLDPEFRSTVMGQITGNENDYRKNESRIRFDIWSGNLHEIVKDAMRLEYGLETIEKFRAQTSINLVPRIIEEKASIYKKAPDRDFTNVTDEQKEYILEKYRELKVNVFMKKANKFYKLQDQDALQLTTVNSKMRLRILQPHHYDVIPMDDDPTQPMAYIVGLNDESRHIVTFRDSTERKQARDFLNQAIGDWDDKKKLLARFAWWSPKYNFITDGHGNIKKAENDGRNIFEFNPFIDIADETNKDYRFWVFRESLLSRFQIDFCKDLTDLTENTKMQGHNQGVIIAEKKPEVVDIGPRKWLYLPLNPQNPELKPEFDFKSPNPDLVGQMSIIKDKLALYLSSDGIDPEEVAGSLEGGTFASGIERMLAQLTKFEASSDDLDLFKGVETDFFEKFKRINNLLAASNVPEYQAIPDDAEVSVKFIQPEKIETQKEKEDRWINLVHEGMATKKRALMEIYEVTAEKADEIQMEIEQEGDSMRDLIEKLNEQRENGNQE